MSSDCPIATIEYHPLQRSGRNRALIASYTAIIPNSFCSPQAIMRQLVGAGKAHQSLSA
jgi:hypothetical protein